jgi:fused signal recognition particle receptor
MPSAARARYNRYLCQDFFRSLAVSCAGCRMRRCFLAARKRKAPTLPRAQVKASPPIEANEEMIQTLFGTPQPSFLDKMKQAVTRTRENLSDRIDEVMAFTKEIDRATLDDLEGILLGADLGTKTTEEILSILREKADRKQIKDVAELKRLIKEEVLAILNATPPRTGKPPKGEPEVIMVVGVNGTGKTTTIGKLAHALRTERKTVLLCAADTFRAAAIEQLEIWGSRTGVEVIKTKPGGDPSAVLFDALSAAKARHTDSVIVDTAGRLHTKTSLMAELEKMKRTAQRIIPGAPHEVLLVMDATTGQNGLQQARLFTESAGVSGIVLTKLDGTAKGGVVVAISRELGLPVRYVGVGEKAGDLLPFNAEDFAESLFSTA